MGVAVEFHLAAQAWAQDNPYAKHQLDRPLGGGSGAPSTEGAASEESMPYEVVQYGGPCHWGLPDILGLVHSWPVRVQTTN
jgi:hypothetical protein